MRFKSVSFHDLLTQFGGRSLCLGGGAVECSTEQSQALRLKGFATLANAQPHDIGFLANPKYRPQLLATQAAVVLVNEAEAKAMVEQPNLSLRNPDLILWIVSSPYLYYARIQQWWVEISTPRTIAYVHPTAVVHEDAQIDASVTVGPNVVIESGVRIGANTRIGAGCVIGSGAAIGSNCLLHANVSVYNECQIGNRVILHSGVVIGADGFGFAPEKGQWVKIPQVGAVIIHDDVEIGANTCIDRGALDDTVIGQGCKLDNLIQIGHNVEIGEHTAMAGCTGVAGTARIGARCAIGGSVNILGHLNIADGTTISPCTTVISSIDTPGTYSGIFPMDEHRNWERNAVVLRNATDLRARIRKIEKQINQDIETQTNKQSPSEPST